MVGNSVASAEFLDLAGRVLDGRAAYRAEGLSARGTRVLQALGYLAPFDLFGTSWAARPGDPGLHIRAKAVPGCGAATLHDLASEFKVSAERIRQIEQKAMQKMRGQLAAVAN